MLCLYFLWLNLKKFSNYVHPYPQNIVNMATPRPAMCGRYPAYPPSGCGVSMQLTPHLVGQLLLLFVQVWWSWWQAAILTWEQTQSWLIVMWIASRCALRDPKFSWGHTPRPPFKGRALHATNYHQKFLVLCVDKQPLHKCMTPDTCTITIFFVHDLSWVLLCYSWLTLLLPQQKFAPAATGLSLAEDSGGKCTHQGAQEVPLTTTAGVYTVCMCERVSACVCIYMSVCEQCCRLCNHFILFKVSGEKFRGATYITVFDGIGQFLITLRQTCQHCNIKGTSPYLELRPGSQSVNVQNYLWSLVILWQW